MEQLGKLNSVMETETIQKNEANLKSQMSKGKKTHRLILLFVMISGFIFTSCENVSDDNNDVVQAKTIRYVKLNGTGDGSSWANAAGDIQTMVDASESGEHVWIASGTYLLSATLQMKEGVNVYGGFAGNESNINQRAKSDLNENGIVEAWEFTNATILDGRNARRVLNQANSFETETTWDGVTITKGKSDNGCSGAYISANGKLNNCIVTQNASGSWGAGIFNNGGVVNNCSVHGNTILSSQAGRIATTHNAGGAGIYNAGTVSNCMIFDNYCYSYGGLGGRSYGGGIYNKGIVNTCCIYNNVADGSPTMVGSYESRGGGIYNAGTASEKAYVYCSTILNNGSSSMNGNYDYNSDPNYNFAYNCITGGSKAILEQNFIRPTSFAGEAKNDAQRAELLRANWRLKQGSQYIEAGSLADLPDWIINGTDLAGNPRVSNGKISVGAYEF